MSEEHSIIQNAYCQSVDELVKEFNTNSEKGLKSSEIEQRHLKYGYNELPKVKKSIWKFLTIKNL